MGLTSFVLTTSRVQTFWGAVCTLWLVPTQGFSQGFGGDFTGTQWNERSWGPCIPWARCDRVTVTLMVTVEAVVREAVVP